MYSVGTLGVYDRLIKAFDATLSLRAGLNETVQLVTDRELITREIRRQWVELRDELDRVVTKLTSGGAVAAFINILLTDPNVECLETAAENDGPSVREVPPESSANPVRDVFEQLAGERSDVAGTISSGEELCPDDTCPLTIDGIVVRCYGRHFAGPQSRALTPLVKFERRHTNTTTAA